MSKKIIPAIAGVVACSFCVGGNAHASEKTVKTNALVRSVPTDKFGKNTVVGNLKSGDVVNVIETDKYGWSKINYNGKESYVASYLLKNPTNKKSIVSNTTVKTESKFNSSNNKSNANFYELSSFSTSLSGKSGRVSNIILSANKLNGLIIKPGQSISLISQVGPISKSNGYKNSIVISNNQFVTGVGGGVCQVSTTLYNALLRAGIFPQTGSQRQPHSIAVKYVSPGLDAAVATGSKDLIITNPLSTDIEIKSIISNDSLTFKILSKSHDGNTYKPRSVIVDKYTTRTYVDVFRHGRKIRIIDLGLSSYTKPIA